jgi:hypothetical protein
MRGGDHDDRTRRMLTGALMTGSKSASILKVIFYNLIALVIENVFYWSIPAVAAVLFMISSMRSTSMRNSTSIFATSMSLQTRLLD